MEKFSEFNDPLTGINPFISPKVQKISIKTVLKALIKLPIYILYILGFPVLPFLLNIIKKTNIKPKRLIYCNKATCFDKDVLKAVFRLNTFTYSPNQTCVIFPENVTTNNTGILEYKDEDSCDYVIGLKYSPEVIYCYGNKILWLIRFLGSSPKVDVTCKKGSDLSDTVNLPKLKIKAEDKAKFTKILLNYKKY